MKSILISIALVTILIAACTPVSPEIEVSDAWARPAVAGGNGAVYLTLVNQTAADDELLSASAVVAGAVEIHLSQMGMQGEMQMIPQGSIPLTPGEKVEFKPGGLHIMLIDLAQDLAVGDHFNLILHFKTHEDIVLDVIVKDEAEDM